jgi:UDP-N-acetylmuramoyl-L-alanyl-D-glutamate--2,6-diaminopimelate ligase
VSAGFYQPMHPMALRDALSDKAGDWLKSKLAGTAQLTADSRRVTRGDGFLARAGAHADGSAYVDAAIAAGAAAIVLPAADDAQDIEEMHAMVPTIRVPRLTDRMGMIAAAFYGRPSMGLQLIAITGTNGKSTTTAALAYALGRAGLTSAAIGTLGVAIFPAGCDQEIHPTWDQRFTNGLTTPDPVDLQRLLRHLQSQGVGAVALEASSIGIEQGRLRGCTIKVAAYTNLSHDHIDIHGSMEAYAKAKSLLFESPSLDAIVINTDDPYADAMWKSDDPHIARIAIGNRRPANAHSSITVTEAKLSENGWQLRIHGSGKGAGLTGAAYLPVFGRYNIDNAMIVAGCLLALKMDAAVIQTSISEFRLPPGRLQMLRPDHAPWVCIDYAHSPDALSVVLEALRPVVIQRGGKLVCVFGCGGDRDPAKRPMMGRISSALADKTVLTSDNPRTESPETILDAIVAGVPSDLRPKVDRQSDRALAIAQTISRADAHDIILIAGKGHERYQKIGTQEILFSDWDHAQRALNAWQQDAAHRAQGAAHA